MLVLSRKVGEKIQIGDDITVVVTRVTGRRVTLGISAPRAVSVVRSELPSHVARPNAKPCLRNVLCDLATASA
jgi:carbon storage regulator